MALLVIGSKRSPDFAAQVRKLDPSLDVRVWPEMGDVADIRYALAWIPEPGVLATLPNLEVLISVGAGIDGLTKDPKLPNVPLTRFVDPDLTGRMVEYVVAHVLHHQRRMTEYAEHQRDRRWHVLPEPMAPEVRVGVMGLGQMGASSLAVLKVFGYQLSGWSRTQHAIDGVECYAGREQLDEFLAGVDILVSVLPLTPDTRGIINRRLLQGLSKSGRHERLPGPVLINAGRGALQVEADILAALEAGELYAATLDVFEVEPLPASSPLWSHPRVVITPHNSAESSPNAISKYCVRQVHRHKSGQPLENLVDRSRGY